MMKMEIVWPITVSLIALVVWLARLEAKVLYLERNIKSETKRSSANATQIIELQVKAGRIDERTKQN